MQSSLRFGIQLVIIKSMILRHAGDVVVAYTRPLGIAIPDPFVEYRVGIEEPIG